MATDRFDLGKNPIRFRSREADALRAASKEFFGLIDEYAAEKNLSNEEVEAIKKMVLDVYLNKMASYFLEYKFSKFNDYFSVSCKSLLQPWQEVKKSAEDEYDYLYLKSTKELLMNEQY